VTTKGFMSEVRSWSAPARLLSGRPIVAGTDERNWSIFIRSKTPLYLVMTDQCASSTAIVPTLPSSLLSRFYGNSTKHFQSQSTHPKLPTGQALTKPPRAKVWSKRFPIQKKKKRLWFCYTLSLNNYTTTTTTTTTNNNSSKNNYNNKRPNLDPNTWNIKKNAEYENNNKKSAKMFCNTKQNKLPEKDKKKEKKKDC